MPDAESFIAAIAANPADDLPRLVYADWLDENGDPARAGFIRDHVALAKLRPGTDEYKTLFRRCADTLRANLPAWIQPACDAFGQPAEWKPGKAQPPAFGVLIGRPNVVPLLRIEFVSGLVGDVSLDLNRATNPEAVTSLFRTHPITRLNLKLPQTNPPFVPLLPARPLPVKRLTLFDGASAEALDDLFAQAAFSNVTTFTVKSPLTAERLVRSPMARRLTALEALGHHETIHALSEFPLDDRIQQLTVLPHPRRPDVKLKVGTATHLGGYISRVSFRPTLKRLDLTRCGMTDEGLAAFARGEEWVRLQGLKLGGNLFGDRGWADFCRGWRTPELTYLDASRNRLTDAGAEMLARSGMLKTLRVIDLRGNRIAGRGAVALARAVAEGKVNRLLLAGNPVGKREAATVKGLLGERSDI